MPIDPNAKLIQQIKRLENIINDLKKEVRFQRREISALRTEQKILFDKDKTPDYDDRLDALEQLSELDQQLFFTEKDEE
jgi:predicted nuclease with TOPRIM domain